jgi:hypothetical protein
MKTLKLFLPLRDFEAHVVLYHVDKTDNFSDDEREAQVLHNKVKLCILHP